MSVRAPVSGVVQEVAADHIGVYIRGPEDPVQDSHDIFAPIDAHITAIAALDFERVHRHYVIRREKRGSLAVTFARGPTTIVLEIEVGSGYVTNEILFGPEVGQFVQAGTHIGEIVIRPGNSYARITIRGATLRVKKGDILAGGKTIIASP